MFKASIALAVLAAATGYSWDEIQNVLIMQGFAGFSLFSIFLLMALGLTIIFGQMKVINMAHGEFLTIGAYVTVLVSSGAHMLGPKLFEWYFPVAMLAAFIVAGGIGMLVEFSLIRFLYKRPLDTLLATWGLSYVLQEIFRQSFGARETSATLPEWMMGSWQPAEGLDIPINGMFLLAVSLALTALVGFGMYFTRWGLRVRATVMNRDMAGAVGIDTRWTDRMTFAIGCGIAGIAGAAFTTVGSISPAAGQAYIVDSFMVVVLGGVGSIIGTVLSAFGIAQTQSVMEFFLSGVLAKVLTLIGVVVFLVIRPQGLIASKIRK